MSRGSIWFEALAGSPVPDTKPSSVLCKDGYIGGQRVRFLCVVPDGEAKFPQARQGEVGLEEGWAIARCVREAMLEDEDGDHRAIVAVVDVPGQAYGHREELLGLHLSLAASVNAYADARLDGHPVIALVTGQAISGAFLAHGLQANRILALRDDSVEVQVMSKRATARITRRSVDELDEVAKQVPATAFDVDSFAGLGALRDLIDDVNADEPSAADVEKVRQALAEAISAAQESGPEPALASRLSSTGAEEHRGATLRVHERLGEEWNG